jgi:predicted nuclease of predicted toxin-antitoxin system
VLHQGDRKGDCESKESTVNAVDSVIAGRTHFAGIGAQTGWEGLVRGGRGPCWFSGEPDEHIWNYALEHDFTVVTTNARDFIRLLKVEVHPGVIVLRESGLTREEQWDRIQPIIDHILESSDDDFLLNKLVEISAAGEWEIREIPKPWSTSALITLHKTLAEYFSARPSEALEARNKTLNDWSTGSATLTATVSNSDGTNSTLDFISFQVVTATPTKFRQTSVADAGNGDLRFTYAWDSTTGNQADLSSCTVGEIVTYQDSRNPWPFPSPPFPPDAYTNPTVIDLAATLPGFQDDHKLTPYTTLQYVFVSCDSVLSL